MFGVDDGLNWGGSNSTPARPTQPFAKAQVIGLVIGLTFALTGVALDEAAIAMIARQGVAFTLLWGHCHSLFDLIKCG